MDLDDANQSCPNTRDTQQVGEGHKQEAAPEEVSEKTDFKSTAEDEKTFATHKQQNCDFQKEAESCEAVTNVLHSFNAFQGAIADNNKDKFPIDVSNDRTNLVEISPASCTSSNLLPVSLEPKIITSVGNHKKDCKDTGIISSRDLPTTESSMPTIAPEYENRTSISKSGFHKRKMNGDFFKEDDDWDIYQPEIFTTKPILTTESSTSGSTTAPKCESKAVSPNHEIHSDFFKEDDDFDIYQSDIVTSEQLPKNYYELSAESSPESQISFKRQVFVNQNYLSNAFSNIRADYTSCLTVSPSISRGRSNFQSRNSRNIHNTDKWFEKMLLRDVKEYFINNPVKVTNNLSDLERKTCIITSPYFSRKFAKKYGLSIPSKPIEYFNAPEEPSLTSRVMAALELLIKLGISKEEFFRYISLGEHQNADTNVTKTHSVMDQDLKFIQKLVGRDIFSVIYQQLTTRDQEFIALFYDQEIYDELQSWNAKGNRCSPRSSSSGFPRISNSVPENNDKKSNKKDLVRLWNSPIKGTQSSGKNIKENSRYHKSEKSNEVLENVSNVKPRVRKYISREDDKNLSKKIRLQENSKDDKQKSNDKEESPKKDTSRTSSQNNWPKKAGENCIVM